MQGLNITIRTNDLIIPKFDIYTIIIQSITGKQIKSSYIDVINTSLYHDNAYIVIR